MAGAVIVRPFQGSDAIAFRALNLAWIERYFTVEASDRAQLDDPGTHIIGKGGRILMADLAGEAVGTVALIPGHDADTVELIKMSAREDVRGQGIGRALMDAAIAAAHDMGARHIWLETNKTLDAALALYRKSGFRELTGEELTVTPYDRCNCQMVRDL